MRGRNRNRKNCDYFEKNNVVLNCDSPFEIGLVKCTGVNCGNYDESYKNAVRKYNKLK